MRKHLLLSIIFLFTAVVSFAQVTSSSMSGTIKDAKGITLPGATIKATHVPSGTVYSAASNKDGLFNIPGMRVGGPYTVEVSFIGFNKATLSNITLQLGQPYILNTTLSETGLELQAVTVKASRKIVTAKAGASTNVNRTALSTLPTFSRSITDFTRLTPQSTGSSFAGRDARLNSVTVDGANLNNTFGTSSALLPGGDAQPISIETYDELSINIAPFDVRQSGFTGAGIYATTKSGTNTFHGSAYTYYKDQSFNGNYIGDNFIGANVAKASTKTYGATFGGPIIKNKLFFFANFEKESSTSPGIAYSPTGGSGNGTVAATTVADLQKVSDYLKTKYGYETGKFDNFDAFNPKNTKYLLKLDWNINDKNKLTVKYSYLNATSDQQINAGSTPNNAPYSVSNGTGGTISRGSGGLVNNRYSNQSIAFENSNYGFVNKVTTGTVELNSSISSKFSNQLLATFKKYNNPRTSKGQIFPTIDIYNGSGSNYITAGSDPYTKYNAVIDNTYSIYDNLTYYAGKHTITGGINYEYQKVGNAFMPGAAGSYIYNSLNDFLTDAPPVQFTYNYSLIPGVDQVFSANLKVGTISLYAQDEYAVSPNFKLTYGLRADKSIYLENPVENPQMTALLLPDANGALKSYNSGLWPKSPILLSPRMGFRWSLLDDNSLVIRGGAGIFTGKIPYVFLTNSPSNSAMYNFGGVATASQLADIKLQADPSVYANLFPQAAGTAIQSATVLIDRNFKFPQVFRTNLAVEKNLGNGFTATLEGLYTKDINAVRMRNANLKAPTGVLVEGDLSRPRYTGTAADRNIYPAINSAIVLENTNKGYASSLTAQISKSFTGGFTATAAYTYTQAKEAFSSSGTTAANIWTSTANVGTTNDVESGYTSFYVPHRVVASASYKFNYLNHAATTIGLFYQGQAGSSPISYVVNGDLNGDGNASTDLMYIPKKASELTFQQYNTTVNGVVYTYTPAQQAAALEQFIKNTPYLNGHRGQYAQRNAAFLPWYNRIDANILQDFYIMAGGQKHTLQLSAVVINLPNLLNKNWGIQKQITYSNPLTYVSTDANTNVPTYQMRQLNGTLVNTPYVNATTAATTWSLLIGAKYIF
ncbi:carboxypeptidase regulatory-like domain-containing protein [Mucilaginibacter rigui]|uniref:Carboxypeptidase regulatory-like domain-containing protein n=1 Tax=Mucilaginibacter rigui TaxID=534635 RepID=A0ABR7X8L7_9SPHI|nr:carboxypeptidase regulatory-like domain-containing protein [Mucilaginibacter rigui]MBD1386876.1 carboxypeptidase regulatory-like domain-containing protein [Mucilaginibacter rigui]